LADSGPSLTQFLLDLTEDEELSEAFHQDPGSIIYSRGLDRYRDLLVRGDVQGLRDAVRREISGQLPDEPWPGVREPPEEGGEPEAIIAGVRIPTGVREPPPPDEAISGVREPPPLDEPVEGVREPPPLDEPVEGVREPPPDSP